ncbi:MAG TPA: GNAT family N-acetyltransferase [Melioribacteraceae bacterium]|nr:GNAT family N-acetyltransferase [Melioribacteraceae bacterium]
MIRKVKPEDKNNLENITNKIDIFSNEEKQVAIELFNDSINNINSDYFTFVYEENEIILGYYVIGKRPLTDAVYDLYWIVVNPDEQNKGIGQKLLINAEEFVRKHNGRWMLAETSSKTQYEATRKFYFRNNYSIVSEIRDFYSIGDSLIVFGKYFQKG